MRTWQVTCKPEVGELIGFQFEAETGFEAWAEGATRYGPLGRIEVRPAIELSEDEGFRRYPEALHAEASTEARDGWAYAASQRGVITSQHRKDAALFAGPLESDEAQAFFAEADRNYEAKKAAGELDAYALKQAERAETRATMNHPLASGAYQ